ncbi:MAG: glycosyltransferase [Tenuifilaceae bacterium]
MRILLLIKRFDFGGAENHVCDLANTLSSLGHNVFIIARNGRQIIRLNSNVAFKPALLTDYLLPTNLILLWYFIKKHKIQIVHAHQRYPILLSCILKIFAKITVVATVHGRTRFDLKSKFVRKNLSRIIFVSQRVLDVSNCYEEIKNISRVIPNGVVIRNHNPSIHNTTITYISRIDKKHSSLILMIISKIIPSLINIYPDIKLNIIGEGKYLELIKKEAEKINRINNKEICFIHGYKPDITNIFESSSLVLGVGRVAIEALASGIPVLCINQNRLGSIISTSNFNSYKNNNFVDVNANFPDPILLQNILNDFFSKHDLWKAETYKLQRIIQEELNITLITQKTLSVYLEVV